MPKRDVLERAGGSAARKERSRNLGLLLAGSVTDIRDLLQLPTIEGLAPEEHRACGNKASGDR
jgi:hypothetical protein